MFLVPVFQTRKGALLKGHSHGNSPMLRVFLTFNIHYGFNKYFKAGLGIIVPSSEICCEPSEQSLFLNWSLPLIIFVKMIHAKIFF